MKAVPVLVASAVLFAACSAPADVVVSRSEGVDPPASAPTSEALPGTSIAPSAVTSTTTPGERPTSPPPSLVAGDLEALLLQEADLPGWVHVGPMPSGGEPSFEAADCDAMATIWDAAEQPGVRSRAGSGNLRLRNTAVEFETVEAADAVVDAASSVWQECTTFLDASGDMWWSEPVPVPAAANRSAGIVIGSDAISGWAIAFWQTGPVVVVLDVNGDDMWLHLDEILATAAARVDGTPAPFPAPVDVVETSSTTPGEAPKTIPSTPLVTIEPPIVTLPPVSSSSLPDDEWPPSWEDWAEHPLAGLVPAAAEFGPDWVYEWGSVSEPEPADESDMIPGCDVPAPATLDGISFSYELDTDDLPAEEFEFEIGSGELADVEAVVATFREVARCDLSDAGFPDGLTIRDDIVVGGADERVVLTSERVSGLTYSIVIVIAQYDGVLIAAFYATDGADIDAIERAVAAVELVASKR